MIGIPGAEKNEVQGYLSAKRISILSRCRDEFIDMDNGELMYIDEDCPHMQKYAELMQIYNILIKAEAEYLASL